MHETDVTEGVRIISSYNNTFYVIAFIFINAE